MVKRRDFIAGSAAVLGTVAAGPRRQERIVIVGAGIAGLVAARRLRDAGIAATLYDSANRVGGRMHSERAYWNDGQHTEWCGAMIDSTHLAMHALARRFNLGLLDTYAARPPVLCDVRRRPRLCRDLSGAAGAAGEGRSDDHVCKRDPDGAAARRHEHARLDRPIRAAWARRSTGAADRAIVS